MFTKIKKLVGTVIETQSGKRYFVAKSKDKRIYAMNLDGNGFFYLDKGVYTEDGKNTEKSGRTINKVWKTNGGHSFGGFDEDITDENLIFTRN